MDEPTSGRSRISRRAFVGALGAAAIGVPAARRMGARRRDVVVIGAGMSGLAAALDLADAGASVTVLEASLRAGGRVRTMHGVLGDGTIVEAGAMQMGDEQARMMSLVRRFGMSLAPTTAKRASATAMNGRVVEPERVREARATYMTRALDRLRDAEEGGDPALAELDRESLTQLLARDGASETAQRLITLGYFDNMGEGPRTISALHALRALSTVAEAGQMHSIVGGNDLLPRRMADALADVRYGAWVESVEWDSASATVTLRNGARVKAAIVIVAIPAAPTRRLHFTPGLGRARRAAIAGLRPTSICRVFVALDPGRFESSRYHTFATDGVAMSIRDATGPDAGGPTIVEAFVTGINAAGLRRLPLADRVSAVLPDLELAYPGAAQAVRSAWSISWDDDPYALGDYPWFAPGELMAFTPYLRGREGRVVFAGEQASDTPGWMEGAVAAGQQAAREALAVLEA
jgi:monoamine oxidase